MTSFQWSKASSLTILSLLVPLVFAPIPYGPANLHASVSSPATYIATLEITNEWPDTLSILAWNNAFDTTTPLPVVFPSITDDQWNPVILASTYTMHAGLSANDFHTLAPGQTFSRTIDLRQIMQDVATGPSSPPDQPKQFTVHLPTIFMGIRGPLNISAKSVADPFAVPPRLGDIDSTPLERLNCYGFPGRFSFVFPVIGNTDPGFASPANGLQVDDDCSAQNLTEVSNAINESSIYAMSLNQAALNWNGTENFLLPYFFVNASVYRDDVSSVANASRDAIQGKRPHADIFCTDIQNLCGDPNVLGYSFTPSFLGDAYVVLCPSARALGRAPRPCEYVGQIIQRSASTSHILYDLVLTLGNVMGRMIQGSYVGTYDTQSLGGDGIGTPDSYTQLAISYLEYGFTNLAKSAQIAYWGTLFTDVAYDGKPCLAVNASLPRVQKREFLSVPAKRSQRASEWTKRKRPATSRRGNRVPLRKIGQAVKREQRKTSSIEERQGARPSTIGLQSCKGAQLELLQIAVANARAMAQYASSDLASLPQDSLVRWQT